MSDFHLSNLQQNHDTSPIAPEPSLPTYNDAGLCEVTLPNAGHWFDATRKDLMEELKPTPRRRRPSGNDHVKHRRTRNGCYTCRSRRVKVDPALLLAL